MKRIVIFSVFFQLFAGVCFGVTTEYNSDGLIVNGYGRKKFTDGQNVSFNYFEEIRLFSAIELDNWNIVKKELDSGIGIDWKVIVIEPNIRFVYTPLIFAIMRGKVKIAKKLIEQGASLDDEAISSINGKEQNIALKDLILQNVFITKTFPSDFLAFYIGKRIENGQYTAYTDLDYLNAGVYSDSKVITKMIEEHLCWIDENSKTLKEQMKLEIEEGLVPNDLDIEGIAIRIKEDSTQSLLISSIPYLIIGCMISEFRRNGKKEVSSKSMEAILNLVQIPFCKEHMKEISEGFKEKVMPAVDKDLGSDEGYQGIKRMFLAFCKQ